MLSTIFQAEADADRLTNQFLLQDSRLYDVTTVHILKFK